MNITKTKTGFLDQRARRAARANALLFLASITFGAGAFGQDSRFFQITPAYSNAVQRALLPEFSDFVRRLSLPLNLPLTTNSILRFLCKNRTGDIGGGIWLTNGTFISFERGHVDLYETTNSYFGLQDPDEIPRFYGEVKLSRADAIRIAREAIQRLGHSLESVFAELEPEVEGPIRSSAHPEKWIPHYQVSWKNPNGGLTSASIAINGETAELTRLRFLSHNLSRPPPKVNVPQVPLPQGHPFRADTLPINPAYIAGLRPLALDAANEFLLKTGLGQPTLTTNAVAQFDHVFEPTGVDTLITLTNGATFVFKLDRITRYQSADAFFTANRAYVIADFKGEWKLTEEEALEKARAVFARLEEPDITLGIDQPPKSQYRPHTPGFDPPLIPRLFLHWLQRDNSRRFVSNADIEVDMETGEITYLGWSHRNMLGDEPKINEPIQPPAEDQ
jgi:hypothetical protein